MPQIYIALNSTWDEANIKQLYLYIGHPLPLVLYIVQKVRSLVEKSKIIITDP